MPIKKVYIYFSNAALAAAVFLLLLPQAAVAALATEGTQILNNIQLVMQYKQLAATAVTEINQYNTMLQNLQRLNPNALAGNSAQRLWQDQGMDSTFRNLYQVISGSQRIAYSMQDIDQNFRAMNPGYGNYGSFDRRIAYRDWSDNIRSAVMGAFKMSTVSANDLQSEGTVIDSLRYDSTNATGQLEALQAGNEIGVSMVSQLQKLRQLQLAQMQAQNTATLVTQGREDAADDLISKASQGQCTKVPAYAEIKRGKKCE